MKTLKAHGWLEVKWADGTRTKVPTAQKGKRYDAPAHLYRRTDSDMSRYPRKLAKWRDALKETRMVVMTLSETKDGKLRRKDYFGVFGIADLDLPGDGATHSFRFIRRYHKL